MSPSGVCAVAERAGRSIPAGDLALSLLAEDRAEPAAAYWRDDMGRAGLQAAAWLAACRRGSGGGAGRSRRRRPPGCGRGGQPAWLSRAAGIRRCASAPDPGRVVRPVLRRLGLAEPG